jgi:hypothetical protein
MPALKAHTLHPKRNGITACGLNLNGSERSRKGAPRHKPPFIVALKDFPTAHERCQNCVNELGLKPATDAHPA